MPELDIWSSKPDQLKLEQDEIHLWRALLNCEEEMLHKYETTLAPDEKSRANRFVASKDRNSFLATRGILRELLGRYADCPPANVVFRYGTQGKPSLFANGLKRAVQFNVSHSHGLALLAFAADRAVGVDVELIRPDFTGDEIAERYFSPEEVAELRALPASSRAEGFFLCWTRKEAYIKGRGEGLHIPLDSFRVSLTPGEPARLTSADSSRWCLTSIRPETGYVGALVAEGAASQNRYFHWDASRNKRR